MVLRTTNRRTLGPVPARCPCLRPAAFDSLSVAQMGKVVRAIQKADVFFGLGVVVVALLSVAFDRERFLLLSI